jgi:CRISPR system Cascade subunit CasD
VTGSTLLLRLAGPWQSWGSESRHVHRGTGRFPTQSGIVGLLAAALGRRRTDPVDDLAALTVDVRIDQPGALFTDYHTVTTPIVKNGQHEVEVTRREYLSDAVFTVAVHGPAALIGELAGALQDPVFPLYLGRKACTMSVPPYLRVTGEAPLDALAAEPWHGRGGQPPATMEVISTDPGATEVIRDVPVSFDSAHRRYRSRTINRTRIPYPAAGAAS